MGRIPVSMDSSTTSSVGGLCQDLKDVNLVRYTSGKYTRISRHFGRTKTEAFIVIFA